MNDLQQKISYLKGLADGLGMKCETKEDKVIFGILDLLEELVDCIGQLDASYSELDDYVEAMDEDLALLEEMMYDDYDDYDDFDEDEYMEFICPNCRQAVYIDYDNDDIICPNCKYVVYSASEDEYEEIDNDEYDGEHDSDE
ncbi:MAG TPA: hypothetical protein GX392_01665 [Clostridiales bacterium]|nr:hypothetical protein [Clostridiales bacterium]